MKLLFLIPLFSLALLSSSCRSRLSREEAEKTIARKEHYPRHVYRSIPKSYLKEQHVEGPAAMIVTDGNDYKADKRMLDFFAGKGMITLTEETHTKYSPPSFLFGPSTLTWTTIRVSPTALGRQYVESEGPKAFTVRVWDKDIGEILPIGEAAGDMVTVTYTEAFANSTPFGDYYANSGESIEREATFRCVNGVYIMATP
jgi:hypothetical protein